MNLFELFAKISIDTSEYEEGIDKAKKSTTSFGDQLMSLTKATAVVTVLKQVANAMIDLAKAGVAYNMQTETYTANLSVLLGSVEAAEKKMQELKDMDKNSPFDLASLADATQQLLAYGIAADDTKQVLQELGDISLGNTEKFNGLAYAYAQMNAAGKANMQDIRQMINAGFNPLNAIAELTGESMSDLTARVSAGKVAFSEIQMAIRYATSAVGTFTEADKAAAAEFAKNQMTVSDTAQELQEAYEKDIEALEDRYEAQKDAYDKQEEALKEFHEDQLEEVKKAQEAEIEAFEKATDEKLALINKQYKENLKLIDEEKYRQLKAIDDQISALKGLDDASSEAAEERERAEKKAALQRQVDTASSHRFREAAEAQLAAYLEEIRQEDLEKERKAKIEELKLQKDTVEAEADEKKESLKEQNAEEIAQVREQAKEQTKILTEQHEEALENYRDILDDELEALKDKNDAALKDYQRVIDQEKKYIEEQNAIMLANIELEQASVTESIESVEGRFFEGMKTQSDTLAGTISQLEAQWDSFLGKHTEGLTEWLKEHGIPFASKLLEAADKFLTAIEKLPLFNLFSTNASEINPYNVPRFDLSTAPEGFESYVPPVTSSYSANPYSKITDARVQSFTFNVIGTDEESARRMANIVEEELEFAEAANG